jgi:hypothetical protein
MFLRYFAEIPAPFGAVERCLLDEPQAWVPGLASDAAQARGSMLQHAGLEGSGDDAAARRGEDAPAPAPRVNVELGDFVRFPSKTVIPIRWSAATGGALFPTFEGDLEIAPLGEGATQLSISVRYAPPLGKVGAVVDRALLHRVSEGMVKDFLDNVAARLGNATMPAMDTAE